MIPALVRGLRNDTADVQLRADIARAFVHIAGVRPEDVSDEVLEECYLLADRILFEGAQAHLKTA